MDKNELLVVGAVIENERGEILCALRSETMSLQHVWEFPGGKVEQGESSEEALVREIYEELGCLIKVHEKIAETRYDNGKVIICLHTYKASIIEGVPVAKEHAEIKWVSRADLPALHWAPADVPTVEALCEERSATIGQ
ncbi:(deoxy)nucleoside triphosphate pyrophosphohydrolase [Anoxybacteroides tepidamans]|uniref:(deoxy)nucleoside triphosphate pyrophosphohydrolase n=1 Tax=Anoxybacteroides tepidamans TaxID=265948 RepID=UPI00054DB998|nr:(deoxy)nucleoside triphosphate pyrophosphohydrolase [Anoxybacillus tepidamans]